MVGTSSSTRVTSYVNFQNKSNNLSSISGTDFIEGTGDGSIIYAGYKNDFNKLTVTPGCGPINTSNGGYINCKCEIWAYY